MSSPRKSWWAILALAAALTGCTVSPYADHDKTFAKAAALAKAGNHAAAAAAYEKLAAPSKPYLWETTYLEAWRNAAESWEAAGDDARALAAYQRQSAAARQRFPLKPGEWPWLTAEADLQLARFQASRQPDQARAVLQQLLAWADALPYPDHQAPTGATRLGQSLMASAELLEKLGDRQQAFRAAMLAVDKDGTTAQTAPAYELPIRLADQLQLEALARQLRARRQAIETVTAMTESGRLPYPPYRKVGDTYESTDNSRDQNAIYYAARAQAYRQLGQELLARVDDRNAAIYREMAADDRQYAAQASATTDYQADEGGSMAGAILGGLLQGAGAAMQQQSGYGGADAAQGLMLQGVGAAVAGDQQTLDQLTRQSLNSAAHQQAAQGNAAGALAAQLAADAYRASPSPAPAGGGGPGAPAATAANGCSDQLVYASGESASFSAAAAQFTAAELQASFELFQRCMSSGGDGECYLFFRNGEPADYPLASLRAVTSDPNDINAQTFRCHAAAGFGAGG